MKNNNAILLIMFIGIYIPISAMSQRSDSTYTRVNMSEFSDNSAKRVKSDFYFGSAFSLALREFRNVYTSEKLRRIMKEETKSKFEIITSTYNSTETTPDRIVDGWHSAIATDKVSFCKSVKILVQDNRIKKFVIDNYLPISFLATGEIKNAKGLVTLTDFNGESLEIVEVYFVYDLEQPSITTEPIEPGFICFWSDWEKFESIKIFVDNVELGILSNQFKDQPDCFQNGTVSLIKSPGIYTFKAMGRGTIDWTGQIEVKSGMCVKYRLGKPRRK